MDYKWIYWGIDALVIVLVVRSLYREKSLREQFVAAMVLVPLLLRAFFIKYRLNDVCKEKQGHGNYSDCIAARRGGRRRAQRSQLPADAFASA